MLLLINLAAAGDRIELGIIDESAFNSRGCSNGEGCIVVELRG